MSIETDTYDSVRQLDREEWDEVAGGSLVRCYDYLCAMEDSQINDCDHFYVVARDGGSIVAHVSLFDIRMKLDFFATGAMKAAIDRVRRWWPGFLVLTAVECGSPVALGTTISFRRGVDRNRMLPLLCGAVESHARERGISLLVVRDFFTDEEEYHRFFTRAGYQCVNNLPAAMLSVRWSTFEEYLASMRSEYRCKIVTQQARFREAGCSVTLLRGFGAYAGTLSELWRNCYDAAREYRREVLGEDFFRNMDACLGERSAVLLARRGDAPVGFLLLLFDGRTLIPLLCGLDYGCHKECATYFNLFYEAVRIAILREMKTVDFALTTLAPKMDLGCDVVSLRMYMKHRNRIMSRLTAGLFRMTTPVVIPGKRRVFKESRAGGASSVRQVEA